MIFVSIKTIGFLKSYHPGTTGLSVVPGTSLRQIIASLNIPVDLVAMVLVNDRQEQKDYLLKNGDKVQLIAVLGGG